MFQKTVLQNIIEVSKWQGDDCCCRYCKVVFGQSSRTVGLHYFWHFFESGLWPLHWILKTSALNLSTAEFYAKSDGMGFTFRYEVTEFLLKLVHLACHTNKWNNCGKIVALHSEQSEVFCKYLVLWICLSEMMRVYIRILAEFLLELVHLTVVERGCIEFKSSLL